MVFVHNLLGIISKIISIYQYIIVAYILFSMVGRTSPGGLFHSIARFLGIAVEPFLSFFRRIIPPLGFLDISPLIGIGVLYFIGNLVRELNLTGHITVSLVLSLIVMIAYQIFFGLMVILLIVHLIRILYKNFSKRPVGPFGSMIDYFYLKWGKAVILRAFKNVKSYNAIMLITFFSNIVFVLLVMYIRQLLLFGISFIPI